MDPTSRLQNANVRLTNAKVNLRDIERQAAGRVPAVVLARIRSHLSGGITTAEYRETRKFAAQARASGRFGVADYIDSIANAERRQGLAQRDVKRAVAAIEGTGSEYWTLPVRRSDDPYLTKVNPLRVPGTGSQFWNLPVRRADDPFYASALRGHQTRELQRAVRRYEMMGL